VEVMWYIFGRRRLLLYACVLPWMHLFILGQKPRKCHEKDEDYYEISDFID